MKLYCDMNIYNRCFDDQSQIRVRLETTAIETIFDRVDAGQFSLFWSFMLEYETHMNPSDERKQGVRLLRELCYDTIIEPSEEIKELAQRIVRDFNVRPRDSVHLACAEVAQCEYFITCDDRVIRLIQREKRGLKLKIKLVSPIDFVREVIANA